MQPALQREVLSSSRASGTTGARRVDSAMISEVSFVQINSKGKELSKSCLQ